MMLHDRSKSGSQCPTFELEAGSVLTQSINQTNYFSPKEVKSPNPNGIQCSCAESVKCAFPFGMSTSEISAAIPGSQSCSVDGFCCLCELSL